MLAAQIRGPAHAVLGDRDAVETRPGPDLLRRDVRAELGDVQGRDQDLIGDVASVRRDADAVDALPGERDGQPVDGVVAREDREPGEERLRRRKLRRRGEGLADLVAAGPPGDAVRFGPAREVGEGALPHLRRDESERARQLRRWQRVPRSARLETEQMLGRIARERLAGGPLEARPGRPAAGEVSLSARRIRPVATGQRVGRPVDLGRRPVVPVPVVAGAGLEDVRRVEDDAVEYRELGKTGGERPAVDELPGAGAGLGSAAATGAALAAQPLDAAVGVTRTGREPGAEVGGVRDRRGRGQALADLVRRRGAGERGVRPVGEDRRSGNGGQERLTNGGIRHPRGQRGEQQKQGGNASMVHVRFLVGCMAGNSAG